MDIKILKALLSFDFYEDNKANLSRNLFGAEIQDAYDIIVEAHEKYKQDLSTSDITALWDNNNPVATKADKLEFHELIEDITATDPLNQAVVSDCIKGLWQRYIGTKGANICVEIADGNPTAMERLYTLVEQTRQGFLPTEFGEKTTKENKGTPCAMRAACVSSK